MAIVLIVDDERDGNDILCRLLRLQGHRPVSAFTGEEALTTLARHPVDVVLLDFMLPGLNGIETLARIRANPPTASLPVIMYTATADPDFSTRASAAGANAYFAKGVMEFSELGEMIEKFATARIDAAAA